MDEYYILLKDENGTFFGTDGLYDDLDDARMAAKDMLDNTFVISVIYESVSRKVVDFFKIGVV